MSARVLAVCNQKGGVGKTAVTMNVAALLAKHSRVLVVDTDPQRSATDWASAAGESLPFDFATEADPERLGRLRGTAEYDTIVVDTPGSLRDEDVLRAVLASSDFALLPVEPHPMSMLPLMRTISSVITPSGKPYRVIVNRVKRDAPGIRRRDDAIELLDTQGVPRMNTVIREYTVHTDAPIDGSVVTNYPRSRQTMHAIDDFTDLTLELTSLWSNGRS